MGDVTEENFGKVSSEIPIEFMNTLFSGGGDEEAPKDEHQHKIALVTFRLLVCVLGVIGNALVIFVILVHREYKKAVTHWYVLQLAIADSLFLLTLPFKVSEDISQEWIFSSGACKAKEAVLFLNLFASVFFLMVMSVDRYIAVCHAFSPRFQKVRTKQAAYIITVVIWVVSLTLCTPIFLYSDKRGVKPNCKCYSEFPLIDNADEKNCESLGLITEEKKRFCLELVSDGVCVEDPTERLLRLIGDGTLNLDENLNSLPNNNNTNTSMPGFPDAPNFGSGMMQELNNSNQSSIDGTDNFPTELPADSQSKYDPQCSYEQDSPYWTQFLYANFVLMFVIPLVIMSACYLLIASQLRRGAARRIKTTREGSNVDGKKRSKSAASLKDEKDRFRVTFICLALVVSFVVCWLPFHTVHLIKTRGMSGSTELCLRIASWTTIIGYLNSAINPFIYNFVGKKFLKRLRSAAGIVKSSVQERATSFSSGAGTVRFRRRTTSATGMSTTSGTVVTKLHKRKKSETGISQAQSSGELETQAQKTDSLVESKLAEVNESA